MSPHRRLLRERQGARARASFYLVAPLAAIPATAMRTTDTSGQLDLFAPAGYASGAVVTPIDREAGGARHGDVNSATNGFSPLTAPTPGIRTSTTATRTTGTRTTRTGRAQSADRSGADFSFPELVAAWLDCRRTKRNTPSALAFEAHAEDNLLALHDELREGSYAPGRSTCFVIRRPKPREVWAAGFRDRVVHHLLYNAIGERFERSFIADTCACIPGRGTLYAARRLEHHVRAITRNWSRPAWYLKCDIANFFVSIDKEILRGQLTAGIRELWWLDLTELILRHDPRGNVELKASARELAHIPPHKSLFNQPAHLGLPIGNLSSQFFANVYLDALDQHVKHVLRCRHYIRYVDDFLLLHESPQQLNAWLADIAAFLPRELRVELNPRKTILQPVDRGIDFVGQVIKPWRRHIRRRTFNEALARIASAEPAAVHTSANSYFGLLRQATASHHDRARLANLVRRRGHAVDYRLTKCYRRIA